MANKTSQHILNTSVNLLGFCLLIITSLHIANKTRNSLVDEFASFIAILLTVSSVLSFISIRTKNSKKEEILEMAADYIFVTALIGVLIIVVLILSNFWSE